MKTKTILKQIDDILALWKGDKKKKQKAVKKLVELRNRLALKVQEEEKRQLSKNPTAYNLFRWYYGLWNKQIPEGNAGRAVNVFKELLEEFKLPEEEIKELYSWWKELDKDELPFYIKKGYSIILTAPETRSITDFKGKLRYIKGLKREIQENLHKQGMSEEYKKPKEDYNLPEELTFNDDDTEDVPF